MRTISSDYRAGTVKIKITDLDDLWYLSQIIEPGDLITGRTARKMRLGDSENAKVVKKLMTLTIAAETIEFGASGDSLRINGLVKEGPEEVPHDSYHVIEIEPGLEIQIHKEKWLEYQKKKLAEASEQKQQFLICILDREEALFAVTKRSGYDVLTQVKGDVPKKGKIVEIKKDFHEELLVLLESYFQRFHPKNVIIASPAFYKDDLAKKINNPDIKKALVTAVCFDVSERALDEVMKRPELNAILKNNRSRDEQLLVEELLNEIRKEGLAVYGLKEVQAATEQGNVKHLLITDTFIQQQKEKKQFSKVDELMKLTDSCQGEVHLLSSEHEGGKKLNGLGGIAALMRYKNY